MSLSVDIFSTQSSASLKADIQIKGVYTTKDFLAVWDYKRVIVYEISAPKGEQALIRPTGTFASDTLQVCLYEHNLYAIDEPGKVKVYTHQVRAFI